MRKARKHYTAEEKVAVLRRHLVRQGAGLEALRRAGAAADGVLPLAKRVL